MNDHITSALGLDNALAATVFAHLAGLAELLGRPLAATRAQITGLRSAAGAQVGDVIYAYSGGRNRLARVVELDPTTPGRVVAAWAVPSKRSTRTGSVIAANCWLVCTSADLAADDAPTSDDRVFELVITRGGDGHLVDDKRAGHGRCGATLGLARTVGLVPSSSAGSTACVASTDEQPAAPAPVGGGTALVTDDAYGAGMLPLAGGDGFLF